MSHVAASVYFNTNKTCFVSLSDSFKQLWKDDSDMVIEVCWGEDTSVFTSWSGEWMSSQEMVIGINGLFASKLGLKDEQQVTVKQVENPAGCERAFVEPLSVDDWEILELHAEYIEASLLNQIRAVSPGMVFPIWVNKAICIFVKIGSIEPDVRCCILEERTEVHITPKDRINSHKFTPTSPASHNRHNIPGTSTDKSIPHKKSPPKKSVGFAPEIDELLPNGVLPTSQQHTETRQTDRNSDIHTDENTGVLTRIYNSMKSWVVGDNRDIDLDTENENEAEVERMKNEYLSDNSDWSCSLRVQPCNGEFVYNAATFNEGNTGVACDVIPLLIAEQPCNVYINSATFRNGFKLSSGGGRQHASNNVRFLAEISRLPSPTEIECMMKKKMDAVTSVYSQKLSSQQTTGNPVLDVDEAARDENKYKTAVVVRVVVLDDTDHKYLLTNTHGVELERIQLKDEVGVHTDNVMLSDTLRRQMGAEKTGRVVLRSLGRDRVATEVNTISVHPLFTMPEGFSADLLKIAVKTWVRFHTNTLMPLVARNGTLLAIPIGEDVHKDIIITFPTEIHSKQKSQTSSDTTPEKPPFILIDPSTIEEIQIKIEAQLTSENKSGVVLQLPHFHVRDIDPLGMDITLDKLGGLGDLPQRIRTHMHQCLCHRPLTKSPAAPGLQSGALLITGPRGVGKTSLARAVCGELAGAPTHAYIVVFECKQLRGKRMDNIKKSLQRCFSEASWRQPAIVVLDDLDMICGAPAGPEQEMSGDVLYFAKVAQVVSDLLNGELREKSRLCVVGTCQSRAAVHQVLSASRGTHYIHNVFPLKAPDKDQRASILKAMLRRTLHIHTDTLQGLDLGRVVKRTEGYVAKDLETVIRRAVHAHTVNNTEVTPEAILTNEDFEEALTGFTPASLKNVSLHKPDRAGWKHIGGLHSVRNTLVETLQWPSKYPELFANCPLRLRSGILLYGAPGTGKTLLAGAVAKECGLNFISIKGPELLSKYIGASEQAVRDTFVRAQSASPCILFFDEFESLAPRRGHDSTGVTDRVVNQLLTQLDGVEGLQGVYILAATSRPDLIDPALLRPGRLDKALLCPLPTQPERLEILEALTRNMKLSPDTDLSYFADTCEHFTGADFKALLYNAQLEAIHQITGAEQLSPFGLNPGPSPARPSVSRLELCEGAASSGAASRAGVVGQKSGSEGSTLSNGSWEKLSESESGLLVIEHPRLRQEPASENLPESEWEPSAEQEVSEAEREVSGGGSHDIMTCDLTYISSLEDGVSEISKEAEEKFKQQILPLLHKNHDVAAADEKGESSSSSADTCIRISQHHLVTALEGMGPSVTHTERRKYRIIYENFVASRGGNFSDGIKSAGKRATLA